MMALRAIRTTEKSWDSNMLISTYIMTLMGSYHDKTDVKLGFSLPYLKLRWILIV